jgi:hypothetical protein
MNLKPNIRGSIGPFTPRGYNKIAQAVNKLPKPEQFDKPVNIPVVFLAQILVATVVLTGRRWKYTWAAANQLSADMKMQANTGDNLNYAHIQVYAYNGCEGLQQNSGTLDGPGLTHASIPTGFSLQPIANGTYVIMLLVPDSNGNMSFVFSIPNAIDGTCA